MNECNEFKPISSDYYPGPYSPDIYRVAVAYFSEEDLSTAVDTAVALQRYYSGNLNNQDFISKLNKGERLGEQTQEPVSIYDGTTYFSKTNFIQRFVIEFLYTDEVLILGENEHSLFKEYLIAACNLMMIPVFRIKKSKNALFKEPLNEKEFNKDTIDYFEQELIKEIEDKNDPIEEIVIGNDYGMTCYAMTKSGEHTSTDLIFPHVPLQVTRRIEEWDNSIDYGFENDFYELVDLAELDNLVGILNYFVGDKYKFKTQDGCGCYFMPSKKED